MLLGAHNIKGSGFSGAVSIDAPKVPEPIQPPAEPYQLR